MPRIATDAGIAEFRNRLCTVGIELFAETGFDGFTMRQLAGRLGISAMTPYRYFKDKDAIISEMRGRAFQSFADWLEIHLAFPAADYTGLGQVCARYAIKEPSQYRLMFALVQPVSLMSPLHVAQERRVRDIIAAHLRPLTNRNPLNGDPERLNVVFWSVLHGAGALYMAGKLSDREFARALCDAMTLFTGGSAEAVGESVNA